MEKTIVMVDKYGNVICEMIKRGDYYYIPDDVLVAFDPYDQIHFETVETK